jgi:aminoglycoside phosphotransferase (APT) family kinase protein
MTNNKNSYLSHESMIELIIMSHFRQKPSAVKRIALGICNEVYDVSLQDKNVIVRMNAVDKFLMGSRDHIPQLTALSIPVPTILFEDYSKTQIPLSYQIQNKIEGQDLSVVIESLSDRQLKAIAKKITSIFTKVNTISASKQFGVIWGNGDNDLSDTWTERMNLWIEQAKKQGKHTNILDKDMTILANNLFAEYKPYFDTVKPVTYIGDISSKNVMIHQGEFNGLVDLDGLTQGDPLEAIGRIKLSWYGTHHGNVYTNAVMDNLGLNAKQRKLVLMYALLNQFAWTCDNGIQSNQNTNAVVDKEKEKSDKKIIQALVTELYHL